MQAPPQKKKQAPSFQNSKLCYFLDGEELQDTFSFGFLSASCEERVVGDGEGTTGQRREDVSFAPSLLQSESIEGVLLLGQGGMGTP